MIIKRMYDAAAENGGGGTGNNNAVANNGSGNNGNAAGAGGAAGGAPNANASVLDAAHVPADWRAGITDTELREHPSLRDIKDINGLAKTFVNQAKMIGQSRLEVPNEKWTDQQWNDFYAKAGRPEKAEGYKVERPQLPDGMTYDEGLEKGALEAFHAAGLNPKQAKALFDWYNGSQSQRFQQMAGDHTKEFDQAVATLKKEYGDKYDSTIANAKLVVERVGGKDLLAKINQAGLGRDPDMIKFLAHAGSFMQEDRAGVATDQGFVTSKEQATLEISRIRGDKEMMAAYNDASHPNHKNVQEALARLYKVKSGG